mgnify:CR=1 FL=1|jgi:hypothetical protein
MSYRFNLIFAKCKSDSDILSAYKSIKNELFKKFKENPELFLYGIPENKGYYTTFLKSIFIFRIYHWKKLNLMALLSDNLSTGFDKNFKSEIYFQNSSDTDYEYETYQNLSPEIDELINKFKSVKSINDLIALNDDIDEYTIQDISKDADALLYYAKSRCYDAVYNILDLDVIANDKENKDIDVYAFNAISSIKELYELYKITNAYLKDNIII